MLFPQRKSSQQDKACKKRQWNCRDGTAYPLSPRPAHLLCEVLTGEPLVSLPLGARGMFSGTSITLDGEQRYLDSHLSYQRACLHAIDYLAKFGYAPEQSYLLLGAAPIEGRLSGVVDIPNSCSTVYLPTAMFDFDVRPSAAGPYQINPGIGAPRASNAG